MNDLWKKSIIIDLLSKHSKKIKQSLGQNYLIDPHLIQKIVKRTDHLMADRDRKLIEIGPGLGSLTQALLEKNLSLTAIEIDRSSIEILEQVLAPFLDKKQLQMIQQDILSWDGTTDPLFNRCSWIMVGNLPYYISSQIIFNLCEKWSTHVNTAIFMLQKEMAERIRCEAGSKLYGILSVLVNYFFVTKKVVSISPNSFYPRPKVHSEVIEMTLRNRSLEKKPILTDYAFFKNLVKAAFSNRRKMIFNAIGNYFTHRSQEQTPRLEIKILTECFKELKLSERSRAENLSVNDYVLLSNLYLEKASPDC